jgi:arginyl-tRNA synthetase
MPTITSILDHKFRQAIQAAFGIDTDPIVTPAQNQKFGDYQANAAMSLAKTVSEKTGQETNRRQIAEQIKAKLDLGDIASEVSIAGPGFINVKLDPKWLASLLESASRDPRLGIEITKSPQTVIVDYSGPNIAKEMHVGHLRSTIIGDAIARTLAFRGDNVIRQNHLGDWGTQFGRVVLAMWYEAVFRRTGNDHLLKRLIENQRAAAKAYAEDQDKSKFQAAIAPIVDELASLHQRFIADDPQGTKYFLPYLEKDPLELNELEGAYVFVSTITDSPAADRAIINHPTHGPHNLAELPRLATTFIQNPNVGTNEQEKLAWLKARNITLEACNQIYKQLGVQLADPTVQREPLERGESFYNSLLADVVKELRDKGLAVASEGAIVVQVPGFETPLIIEKKPVGSEAAGGYLYGTTDLAAIRFRVTRLHADRIVYFVDARQSQHFAQVFWTAREAGWAKGVTLEHAAFGTMLGPDGKPFKTRSGDTVKLKDLLAEADERARRVVNEKNAELPEAARKLVARAVGIGGVKYADLSKDRTSDYMFSFDKMLALDGNTAPYLQYAYARTRSLARKAASRLGIHPESISLAKMQLEAPAEIALAKHVLRLNDVLEAVARELKPHHLCNYLYELATRFSAFWENCPVLTSEEPLRSSRLALAELVARTMAKGLDLLGIEHPEQM